MGVNPYEADPKRVPKKDPYLNRSPHYGRYAPQTSDFEPKFRDWHNLEESNVQQKPQQQQEAYWTDIVRKYCTPENSVNAVGSRDTFAVGKVIIRVDSDDCAKGSAIERYSRLNTNELVSSRKARKSLKELDVAVPVILFCGTIDGKNTVVETRIPGVSLEVAWNYLSSNEKESFKTQCQRILQHLAVGHDHPNIPSYVCEGLNVVAQPDLADVEHDILFASREEDEVLCLAHNDMVRSNIIVDKGRVVAILGWRQSGYFGYERARKIHRLLRIPERSHIFSSGERSTQDQAWADLYDFKGHGTGSTQEPRVKAETPAASIEKVPAAQSGAHTPQYDGADEHPTPKKISDLKRGSTSRASSIDRSSPSAPLNPSKLGPNARKSSVSSKKASTAVKIPSKKRKIDTLDTDSVDDRRSNSPASSVKGPTIKKRASASVNGSPAPEAKKKSKPTKKKPSGKRGGAANSSVDGKQQGEDDEGNSEVENPHEIFCICRRPDNHTWMIGCDGDCEDWFHGKCVNIKQEDEALIERYICPNCQEAGKGQTTWKPMCRLKSCRKSARVSKQKISKYCSDEHGREFMLQMTKQLRWNHASSTSNQTILDRVREMSRNGDRRSVDGDGDSAMDTNDEDDEHDRVRLIPEDLGSRGGVLTVSDLKAVIMGVSTSAEFRRLGDRLITPPPSTSPPARRMEKKAKEEEEEEEDDEEDEKMANKVKKEKDNNKEVISQDEEFAQEELFSRNKMGLDIHPPGVEYSTAEEAKLQELREQRNQYRHQRRMISRRNQFLGLVRARAKAVLDRLKVKEPKAGWKDVCGWDERMAWNEEELDDWRQHTGTGRKAFEEKILEAEPVEDILTSNDVATIDDSDEDAADKNNNNNNDNNDDNDNDNDNEDNNSKKNKTNKKKKKSTTTTTTTKNNRNNSNSNSNNNNHNNNTDIEFTQFSRGVCMKKRCDRHKQWIKIVQQDIQFEEAMLKTDFEACEKEANAIVEGAILRIYAG